jgi:MYXO-CTERM domain-containing protein
MFRFLSAAILASSVILPTSAYADAPAEASATASVEPAAALGYYAPEPATYWHLLSELGFPVPFSSFFESDLIPLPTRYLAHCPPATAAEDSVVLNPEDTVAPPASDPPPVARATLLPGLLAEATGDAPTPARQAAWFGLLLLGGAFARHRHRHIPGS